MWMLDNRTPYKADRLWGRDKDGVHQWIVATKATYDINPDGSLELAEDQLDPIIAPEYNGDPGASSLKYDMDLTLLKPTTDVILNGTAYAPEGRPSTDFMVSMRVGPITKTLRVLGNRWYEPTAFGSRPSVMQPITKVPIVYERAYGGYDNVDPDPKNQKLDVRNPVGCGIAAHPDHLIAKPVHNFEYPNGNAEKVGPAGFGVIDHFWSPRRELAGTYDDQWNEHRKPLLPTDWKPEALMSAPADQQANSYLHGGEAVELYNLTPGGRLQFLLPKVYLTFKTRFNTLSGDRNEEHRSRLTSVIIEPDFPRVAVVWVTNLTCRTDVDYLDVTVIREKDYV